MAFGAIDAVRSLGKSVPDDVSVVGFDDVPQAAQSYPGLTTVRQPLYEMGRMAANALIATLASGSPPDDRMLFPTTLKVRGTTTPSPAR